ncbi:probable pyruvate dehydrogenase E1 component subunit alpha, mitochondrial [Anthonomus grandis grandis]|uniref:probable pyruvate dehydrogenase E1 component subunit alpha, mitochondrial n=1 Tax=Anthonomus grandis grandis TaxID=2921223 RepID=UPI00216669D5|nr:probable pyruvate dehydrogenase E1 component subunit alpha, mitochondrial [Anthonomus grandis grandis]
MFLRTAVRLAKRAFTPQRRSLVLNVDQLYDESVYKLHLLDQGPSHTSELSKSVALTCFERMDLVRKVENTLAQLYREKKIRGFCHLYVGQEAVAVGIFQIMRPQDTIITSYRCHGWAVLKGGSVASVFAELLGHVTGLSRGKGGSMHLYAPRFFGGNGIVGSHVPLGVGIGFKHHYLKEDAICVTLFGDGAANQGQVFEAFNLAKLQDARILFVVENNIYGMGTSTMRSSANTELYRQCAYLPGIRASGMDILSIMECTKFCFDHIKAGKGPIVLELMTYRYFGHSMSDPGTSYRDREEIQTVREKKDCIAHIKKLILDSKLASDAELKEIETKNKEFVAKELEAASKGTDPPLEELVADVYSNYPDRMRIPPMLTWMPYKTIAHYDKK